MARGSLLYYKEAIAMTFWQYVFRFLYVRNWHTGRYELSRQRMYWFVGLLTVLAIMLVIIYLLQASTVYSMVV